MLAYEPDRLIGWTTSDEGEPPLGVRWRWELNQAPGGRTTVVYTYDWTNVSEADRVSEGPFPRVPAGAMRRSITLLVAAATG